MQVLVRMHKKTKKRKSLELPDMFRFLLPILHWLAGRRLPPMPAHRRHRLPRRGASAVDKRQQAPPTGGGLRRVFGAGHPFTWALPALAAPRGTPGGGGSWAKEA